MTYFVIVYYSNAGERDVARILRRLPALSSVPDRDCRIVFKWVNIRVSRLKVTTGLLHTVKRPNTLDRTKCATTYPMQYSTGISDDLKEERGCTGG
jgi:hypothetical protein